MGTLNHVLGGRVPLFERFHARGGDASVLAWHGARQDGTEVNLSPLECSIEQELTRLLNTRCACPLAVLATRERSVIDYGLPDYSALCSGSSADRARLVSLVRDTIVAFEPRLRQVEVEIALLPNCRHALQVGIRGAVLVNGRLEPVRFNLSANGDGAGLAA
ncbi:type VI secretion system baseplate subunit TssE [Massilia sp. CF038]|uniref:type VI secretion system baseplate subunit TssE n=1 Tax=Massilia sp. CF038 TaxID=1881045 RepID=UPI00091470C3|nr:type VI secretion system baseplate subunit TssE [Massilia sp. CF038]SHH10119.1 type VI secretion system protein ImpF [Massilia sp. CF038]